MERLLLHEDTLREPLPTEPSNWELVMRIREATDAQMVDNAALREGAPSALLRGALFYFHNALEDAHREFAKGEGDTAAYWHGMVHRREGDFENARYWMRRAGELPVFQEMLGRAGDSAPQMARQANWDPFLFNSLCEQFKYGEASYLSEIVQLQRVEFAVLFNYVWRQCVAPAAKAV